MSNWMPLILTASAIIFIVVSVVVWCVGKNFFLAVVTAMLLAGFAASIGVTLTLLSAPQYKTLTTTMRSIVHSANALPPPSSETRAQAVLARSVARSPWPHLSIIDATTHSSNGSTSTWRFNVVSRKVGKVACVTYTLSTTVWAQSKGACR
jgi:hypothetical protein